MKEGEKIKRLRMQTGVAITQCKQALIAANGQIDAAVELLRKQGIATAARKMDRPAAEGTICYAEEEQRLALVEVRSETDFVVHNARFQQFANNLCRQIASSNPETLDDLLAAPSLTNPQLTVAQERALAIHALGENLHIQRYTVIDKPVDCALGVYSHRQGRIVSVVIIHGSSQQQALAEAIAIHVVAANPTYLSAAAVPAAIRAKEEEIARAQIDNKPPQIIDSIVAGKLEAFYRHHCLLQQEYVKDPQLTIAQLLAQQKGLLTIQRFLRWEVSSCRS